MAEPAATLKAEEVRATGGAGYSESEIARALGMSRASVRRCLAGEA